MIMAHYAKHSSLLFLLALIFTLNIEARESKFFSKTTHDTKDNRETVLTSTLLAPVPAPAPEIDPTVIEEGYGLYGHHSNDRSNDVIKTKRNPQSYNQEQTRYPYNKDDKYENGGYLTKGYKSDNYKNGNYDLSYDNNGYVSGKLRQSDTRSSHDGKYFDNVGNVNNYNGYGAKSGLGGEREGYYGNNENEFDTMEEYEKQQGYPEIQGEYYNP